MKGGAAPAWLVHNIDSVTLAQEILRPALAAIRRSGEVRSVLAAAMDHHDRIGLRARLRDLILDIRLALQVLAVGSFDVSSAGIEVALLGDLERRRLGRTCRECRSDENRRENRNRAL